MQQTKLPVWADGIQAGLLGCHTFIEGDLPAGVAGSVKETSEQIERNVLRFLLS